VFGYFDITVGDLAAEVVPSQLEPDLPVKDVAVRMVVDGLEIRDQTVDETERLHEVLKLELPRQLVTVQRPPSEARHHPVELFRSQRSRLFHRSIRVLSACAAGSGPFVVLLEAGEQFVDGLDGLRHSQAEERITELSDDRCRPGSPRGARCRMRPVLG